MLNIQDWADKNPILLQQTATASIPSLKQFTYFVDDAIVVTDEYGTILQYERLIRITSNMPKLDEAGRQVLKTVHVLEKAVVERIKEAMTPMACTCKEPHEWEGCWMYCDRMYHPSNGIVK